MAEDAGRDRQPLTASRLRALHELTRALGEAISRGEMERAQFLLDQRGAALSRIDWERGQGEEVRAEIPALLDLEQEILEFWRTWRGVLKERLEALGARHLLRLRYGIHLQERKFVDLRK